MRLSQFWHFRLGICKTGSKAYLTKAPATSPGSRLYSTKLTARVRVTRSRSWRAVRRSGSAGPVSSRVADESGPPTWHTGGRPSRDMVMLQ